MGKQKKIGRNDPCPCGSGKKFKNCCGQLNDIKPIYEDPFLHYSQLMSSAKLKLDNYYKDNLRKHRKTFQTQFARFTTKNTLIKNHESIFSDWVWFDILDDDGLSVAGNYLRENRDYMEAPLRECLEAMDRSYISVYRVIGCRESVMYVNDIFLNINYQIILKEPLALAENDPEVLLLARLIQLPDANVFSGMVFMIENKALQDEFIKEHVDYVHILYGLDYNHLLKENGEIIYGIFEHAAEKVLVNLADMRAATLTENDIAAMRNKLNEDDQYILQHETAGLSWYKSVTDSPGYSRIILGDHVLISCADVLEDVTKQIQYINTILPDQELRVIHSTLLQSPPDPEYSTFWFTVLKDREFEKWIITPHGEFNGLTPKEKIKEDNGLDSIIQLLEKHIASAEYEEERELLEYIKDRCLEI